MLASWINIFRRDGLMLMAQGLAALFCFIGPALQAHDSPEHVVALLTDKMKETGVTASLLHARAIEYRALGNLKAAAADLLRARKLEPGSLPVLQELCRVQQASGQYDAALETIAGALSNSAAPAELWIVRAEIQLDRGAATQALAACEHAFQQPEPPLDWYLVRSRAQAMLNLRQQRVKDLQEGLDRTGSSILKLEWVDALIAAKDFARARQESDAEIRSSRWRSTWLLRRAQCQLGLGKLAAGHKDLREVIAEIEERLNPAQPDVTLLADRGLAWALLGQSESARQDLASAIQAGADDWVVRPLKRLLPE